MSGKLGQAMLIIEEPGKEKRVVMCDVERIDLDEPKPPVGTPTLVMIQNPGEQIHVHMVPNAPQG